MKPLLSIVIPTFERSAALDGLLRSIAVVDLQPGELEICISDNCSTDTTPAVISDWAQRLPIRTVRQPVNCGGSENVVRVMAMAAGDWAMPIGDDDRVDPRGLKLLVKMLRILKSRHLSVWILTNASASGRGHIDHWQSGPISRQRLGYLLLRDGLRTVGFIGVHVIPRHARDALTKYDRKLVLGWPHVALFAETINRCGHLVIQYPVVLQAKGGKLLEWKSLDWLRLNLRRVVLFLRFCGSPFLALLIGLREICSREMAALVIRGRIDGFSRRDILNVIVECRRAGALSGLMSLVVGGCCSLWSFPPILLCRLVFRRGPRVVNRVHDGMNRKL